MNYMPMTEMHCLIFYVLYFCCIRVLIFSLDFVQFGIIKNDGNEFQTI